jgi:hypothetical protein
MNERLIKKKKKKILENEKNINKEIFLGNNNKRNNSELELNNNNKKIKLNDVSKFKKEENIISINNNYTIIF